MKKLYAFYEQGLRCYRNQLNGMDDFEMVRFFYYSRNGMDKILNGIRTIYIRSVLAIIFIALGKKNIFPTETKESQKQKNRGLYSIIDDYDEFISDFDFSTNGTYYLIWNFINEIIEWGFCEAKIVNDFRKNVILPYYKWKGLGLKNNDENVMPLTMDKIREEIIESCSKSSIFLPPFNPEDPTIPLLRFKDFR